MVAETEAIGISVLDSLAEQRESLLSSRNKVGLTDDIFLVPHHDPIRYATAS